MPDKGDLKIPIVADAKMWMVVLANVRLALRHPGNTGLLSDMGYQFATQLEEKLVEEGVYSINEVDELRRAELRAQN